MAESTADRLDALRTLVQQAKAVPISASCVVNRAEVLGLIEAAQASLVQELAAAKDVANASPPAIERAQEQADQIVRAAEKKAAYLVDSSQVLTAARDRAGQLESRAIAESEGLRREADVYVDGRIAAMEAGLQKQLTQLQTIRARLATRSGLDADETTTLPKVTG